MAAKTAGTGYLHIKRVNKMAREVFEIVNNIAPTLIENLFALKRSQYSLRNDKSAVIPRVNTTKYGLNHLLMKEPESGPVSHMSFG